jgi:hypothetical protein
MYEGVNVDIAVPGYTPSGAATRANNIIAIANERLVYLDGIETSYMNAYRPLAAAQAYDKTLDIRSRDPSVRNAIIASQIEISKLYREVTKWTDIVKKNQGKINIDGTPDFTIRRNRYKADIAKYNKILDSQGPQICTGLPPYNAVQDALMNNARAENDARTAPILAQEAIARAAGNSLAAMVDRGADGNSPGIQNSRDPAYVNGVLNQVIASGGVESILNDVTALKLAWDSSPETSRYSFPTNSQLQSVRKSPRLKTKKNPTLSDIISELQRAGGLKPRSVSAGTGGPPGTGGPGPLPKPAAKPAPAPKPKPPKPKGRG